MRRGQRQTELRPRHSAAQVRQRLGSISRATLWRWIEQRGFPRPVVIGHVRLFDVEAVERWIEEQAA